MSYWVFHASPSRSPALEQLLAGQTEVRRCLTQHTSEVSVGDGAVLWLSGRAAGVYAVGEVVGAPVEDPVDGEAARPRRRSVSCLLRWSELRPEDPVLKHELLATGRFGAARIVRQPMGGNPLRLTPEEWQTVHDLLR